MSDDELTNPEDGVDPNLVLSFIALVKVLNPSPASFLATAAALLAVEVGPDTAIAMFGSLTRTFDSEEGRARITNLRNKLENNNV